MGRFLQTDPIGYEDQYNLYAYVGNDPVNKIDPTGETAQPAIIGKIIFREVRRASKKVVKGAKKAGEAVIETIGATVDFIENFVEMREANTIGMDKFNHCKANCEASARGTTGEKTAKVISDTREITDQMKGDPPSASVEDEKANVAGRNAGRNARNTSSTRIKPQKAEKICRASCSSFNPNVKKTEKPIGD